MPELVSSPAPRCAHCRYFQFQLAVQRGECHHDRPQVLVSQSAHGVNVLAPWRPIDAQDVGCADFTPAHVANGAPTGKPKTMVLT